jgi:hypothetical protein
MLQICSSMLFSLYRPTDKDPNVLSLASSPLVKPIMAQSQDLVGSVLVVAIRKRP